MSAENTAQRDVVLARWSTRFWAWLVDFIIVNVAVGIVFAIAATPLWLTGFFNPQMMTTDSYRWNNGGGPLSYAISSLVFFAYWTYFESTSGQSIGKKLLKIKTVRLSGSLADVKSVAIQSFGKAFLLPIDVLLGWIFTNDKRQRIFNRASDTIVVKISDPDGGQNVNYTKD